MQMPSSLSLLLLAACLPMPSVGTGNNSIDGLAGRRLQECKSVMEVHLVLDRSGSMSDDDVRNQQKFSSDFVDGLSLGNDEARVGVTHFCREAKTMQSLTSDKRR